MILKNVNFGACENSTIILFGQGDVWVATANDIAPDSVSVIIMDAGDSHKIGETDSTQVGKNKDDVKMDVVMRFDKLESIDVVIDRMKAAKKLLAKKLSALPPSNKAN